MTENVTLDLQNIHAAYGRKEILRGVSLSLQPGEIAALIGPNGSGKSTLVKVVAGVLKNAVGIIRLNGEDITKMSPRARVKKGIGYFMQGGEVFHAMTVSENLALSGYRLSKSEIGIRTQEIFSLFPKLQAMGDRRAGFLSGGERQALALGMVLINRPKLLLLDEPSAGLSPSLVKNTLSLVQQFNQKYETTVILVEQNVREALQVSRRAFLLKNGQVVSEEHPAKLLENENAIHMLFFN